MDISFQLYSGRKNPPIGDLLAKVARLGYRHVEGYSTLYEDVDGLAELLRTHGLLMSTAHFGFDQLKDTAATMRVAEKLGVRIIFCPAVAQSERSGGDDKWMALGETLAGLGETYRRAGFGFGWHNHAFEFEPTPSGKLPMEILLETGSNNDWEMDVAWIVKAGQDPLDWIRRFGPRISAVHVKDIAAPGTATDEDGWADVGHGTMDWAAIAAALKAQSSARYYVMEHDNPNDVERFARRSLEVVKAWA